MRARSFAIALVAVAAALLVRLAVDPILGSDRPLPTLYGAVCFAVWYGDALAASIAAVLGYLAANYLFIEPRGQLVVFTAANLVGTALYLLSAVFIIAIGTAMRRAVARERAARLAHEAAEQRLREHERLLAERTSQLETLFATVPTPIWISEDAACERITGNPAGYAALGIASGENLSMRARLRRSYAIRDRHDGRELAPDQLPLHRACREGRVVEDEIEVVRDDGEPRVVRAIAAPIRDAHGDVVGAVCSALDLTDHIAMERALHDADRRKDEFLAMLAHELRNPLAPIRSAVALLDGANAESLAWARGVIDRQSQHLARLLDDILDVSRIARGKLVLRRERVDLRDVVAAAIETTRPALEARRHVLELSLAPAPMPLDADPLRLQQVLANLLHNAARCSEPGRPIRLTAAPEGEGVLLTVRDEGIGISPDALTRIFELFRQEPEAGGSIEGLGVGLWLVKELVELHGGRVEAHSDGPGKGSSFAVRLPSAVRDVAAAVSEAVAAPDGAPAPRRILVADDNRDAADSLSLLLGTLGHETRTAYDGRQAFELARSYAPEIAFLDLGMPGLDGLELARRIRREPWGRAITLVALTGWGQPDDRRRSTESGFDRHLTKPVEKGVLLEAIAAWGDTRG